jgi:DNA polymerase-4
VIGCLLIPCFAAAIERQADGSLATAPLILSQPPELSDRVFAASAEALRLGVRPGLRLRQAQTLCPRGLFLTAQPGQYRRRLTDVLTLLTRFTAKVEPEDDPLNAAIYLDLAGLAQRERVELAEQIGRTVWEETKFTASVGLALGKFPAYIAAASIGPQRVLCIAPGQERSFLAPLPVESLPLDPESARRFDLLGLRTVAHLAELPRHSILAQFGSYGQWLYRLAQGEDDRPVRAFDLPPREAVRHSFDEPVADRLLLVTVCRPLAETLAGRLQAQGRAAGRISLTLELENETTWSDELLPHYPTDNAAQLARHLTRLLHRAQVSSGVTAVAIQLDDLIVPGGRQLDLWAGHPLETEQRLRDLLPLLIARYGPGRFYEAVLTNRLALLPEHRFTMKEAR